MKINQIAKEILSEGLDDWVRLTAFIYHVEEFTNSATERRAAFVETLIFLLEEELMVVGDLGDQVIPWPGDADAVVARAVRECERLDWDPRLDGCWFANTDAGDRWAQDPAR
ncbi:hypothetical protein [Streptomyces beijiangensis]|uniref:Uncharacterized protein n=1 Tax=Streptomyces beijiangensis TaxID=163361 RepID=A0A939FA73_9ACTN|nr:hypothetical protein [Streptomyces beijiangensis]MBO0513747.1 hypothetical protein [Streptomyces beijiangensis]